jgi:dimethylaniline monooxygenase (N-oxide forming)
MVLIRISALVPVPGISSVQPDSTIVLADGRQLKSIDVIIFATGFINDPATSLGFSQEILDRMHYKPERPHDFPRYRYELTLGLPELCLLNQVFAPTGASVGFDIRSMWIAGVWSGNVKLPSKENMEKQSKKEAKWLDGLYKL